MTNNNSILLDRIYEGKMQNTETAARGRIVRIALMKPKNEIERQYRLDVDSKIFNEICE